MFERLLSDLTRPARGRGYVRLGEDSAASPTQRRAAIDGAKPSNRAGIVDLTAKEAAHVFAVTRPRREPGLDRIRELAAQIKVGTVATG